MTWYYVNNGEAAGPVTNEEFQSLLRRDIILPTTLVWKSGMKEWEAASLVAPKPRMTSLAVTPDFSPEPSIQIDAPPELASGTPPVLPNFFCTFCGTIIPADQLVRINARNICAACKPGYVQQMQEGLSAPFRAPVIGNAIPSFLDGEKLEFAEPWPRFVAHLFDSLLIMAPVAILGFLFFALVGALVFEAGTPTKRHSETIGFVFFGLCLITFVWVMFYWTYFIGKRGATPGMKIMKIKMVRGDRTRVTYGRAFGRALLLYVINIFTMGLTNLSAFFDREKRTVTDMICDTRVIRN